jgi:hypothetical protein
MTFFSAYGRRFAAACLLQLFWVFVHVVKQVHSHDRMETTHAESNGFQSQLSKTGCSICDYQVAKEAYGPNNNALPINLKTWQQDHSHQKAKWICKSISTESDRGPPCL